ncbi:protein PERCC1 [Electrophorus electricus]|uniref:protein PERCC1 n=1 Tax=Electrophorus electricus TaxID=8005 RepID=UPI0015CFDE12|nr:protein PERCC1 [Electrophorus electricus]
MAASVIRTLSGFRLTRPARTCLILAEEDEAEEEYDEELREEAEADFEDEGSPAAGSPEEEQWGVDPSFGTTEATDRLLRFAELISSDVQRYFGRGQDPDACDMYTDREGPEVGGGQQRYYANFVRAAVAEQREEPEKLGPLAELFQETQQKKQGLPMNQRRLPSSFWTEPHPYHLTVPGNTSTLDMLGCSTETGISNSNTSVRMLSTSSTPISTISSSGTPDFSDLLAHWASDRDNPNVFSCEYQLP